MLDFTLPKRSNTLYGQGKINLLKSQVTKNEKVLFLYGLSSIKKNGTYDIIVANLKETEMFEFSGISSNPKLSDVRIAIELVKKEQINKIVAVGGGSVIDAAKAIAVGARYDGDVWDLYSSKQNITDAIDIITVVTNVATGSETNDVSVLVNDDLNLKRSIKTPLIYPKTAILDCNLTLSVGMYTTKYGLIDAFSHVFEEYFNNINNPIIDTQILGLMKNILDLAPKLLNDLENVELRDQHMLLAYLAYNCDIRNMVGGDFACHGLDYGLASVFDTTHGAGLSILMPNWMKFVAKYKPEKIATLGRKLFAVTENDDKKAAQLTANKMREYLNSLSAASCYEDINVIIGTEELAEMIEKAKVSYPLGNYYPLESEDIKKIYEMGFINE